MNTTSLRSFAVWARTTLVGEVSARIAVVLAPGASEGVEQPRAVDALRRAVAAAGGGLAGVGVIADKVAYTWFNRIVALRFMDANGYTGTGVVSPERGSGGSQPEILAEAKRGNFDLAVIGSQRTVETVMSLLDGTRRSDDAQGEAYALLLAEYCRHWNRSMPFMFEREGDYTELLIPSDLLADDSVRARAVAVLTAEVCRDVEVIGWLYQFYVSERKDEIFAGFKKNKKAGAAEIPAATQLFTPHWIVRYLVENSLGRLWLLNRPDSRLAGQMEYYIAPADAEVDFLKVLGPEELKVIDPACGSGHMLTYAFDLLYAIYEEEGYAPADIPSLILTNNLYGTEIDPRAGALAAFALTMKARARQRTFFNKQVPPNICVLEPVVFTPFELDTLVTPGGDRSAEEAFWNQFEHADTFGSLIRPREELIEPLRSHLDTLMAQEGDLLGISLFERARRVITHAEYLSPRHNVLVANPPYMGSGNMDSLLATYARENYPATKADLFAMFIERSFSMLRSEGYSAMVTMESWMFLKSFKELREVIVKQKTIENMIHMPYLGKGSTSMGINFGTSATVLRNGVAPKVEATFQCIRHFETDSVGIPLKFPVENERSATLSPGKFSVIPGMPIAYWFTSQLLSLFESAPSLSSIGRAAKGLVTADNASFVREWWEVSHSRIGFDAKDRQAAVESGCRWFPYAKGGDFRRWAGNSDAVVNWERDGHAIQTTVTADGLRVRATNFNVDRIFKPGIAWTVVTSGKLSFRSVGAGFLFDAAAGICQTKDDEYVLAFLNSSPAAHILQGLNPTLNLHPGYLEAVPLPIDNDKEKIRAVSRRALQISTSDWNLHERSWKFSGSPLLDQGNDLSQAYRFIRSGWEGWVKELRDLEVVNNRHFAALCGFDELESSGELTSLTVNPDYAYANSAAQEREGALMRDSISELVSYAVACMFGRFSLDEPGLILANQGDTLKEYLARVPVPSFMPDADNVIPIVDGEWFEDDIVGRFRQFLRVAFGEQHFEENLRFVTESLGVKDLRDYFVRSFYKDHVQRYKKRPIYWLFSSPKGSFNALIYMHRYTPSTVSTVLNEYLREFTAKLEASRQHHERLAAGSGTPREQAAAQKEVDRLRKVLLELGEYEHDVLYPLAAREVKIDLDDGVKANYPKFGAALKRISGLEASVE